MFRESEVRQAIKNLIEANKTSLLSTLTKTRTIHQVTTSVLTPPEDYFFILVYVSNVHKSSLEARSVQVSGLETITYTVHVVVIDYAEVDINLDAEEFETADADFQKLTDGIANLINSQKWFTVGTTKGQLVKTRSNETDRVINKTNETVMDMDGDNLLFRLDSDISFTIQIDNKSAI